MPAALIAENGTGLAQANSYATLLQIRAYNAQRGVEIPDDDDAAIVLATQALDLLETYEPRFRGERVLPLLQALSWPRMEACINGSIWDSSIIPTRIVNAQCYLAGIATTVELQPVITSRAITKDVIGPLETDYSDKYGAFIAPIIPQLDAMLQPLLNPGFSQLKVTRI